MQSRGRAARAYQSEQDAGARTLVWRVVSNSGALGLEAALRSTGGGGEIRPLRRSLRPLIMCLSLSAGLTAGSGLTDSADMFRTFVRRLSGLGLYHKMSPSGPSSSIELGLRTGEVGPSGRGDDDRSKEVGAAAAVPVASAAAAAAAVAVAAVAAVRGVCPTRCRLGGEGSGGVDAIAVLSRSSSSWRYGGQGVGRRR